MNPIVINCKFEEYDTIIKSPFEEFKKRSTRTLRKADVVVFDFAADPEKFYLYHDPIYMSFDGKDLTSSMPFFDPDAPPFLEHKKEKGVCGQVYVHFDHTRYSDELIRNLTQFTNTKGESYWVTSCKTPKCTLTVCATNQFTRELLVAKFTKTITDWCDICSCPSKECSPLKHQRYHVYSPTVLRCYY